MGAFAAGVAAYAEAGWPCILPVPARTKTPPPAGFTGDAGVDTSMPQLLDWSASHADHGIALRMPGGVIGLDVDHYDKDVPQPDGTVKVIQKRGADTIAKLEADLGPLPPTWCSTARGSAEGPGPSRILLFRTPAGNESQRYVTKLRDVEIIQRHHRYAVVWPSTHAAVMTGWGEPAVYQWYTPEGAVSSRPPQIAELAELPPAWAERLAEGATDAGPAAAAPSAGRELLDAVMTGPSAELPECADVADARMRALTELGRADQGSRHDTVTARVHHLVHLAAGGHTGVPAGLQELFTAWQAATAGEGREQEFWDCALTSARKAVTVYGTHPSPRDPCVLNRGFDVPGPQPVDNRERSDDQQSSDPMSDQVLELAPVQPPRWWSLREHIGPWPFELTGDLDQTIAQNVLARVHPAVRYAYDSGEWLVRLHDRWESRPDLSGWAVAELAWLMPTGDSSKEADEQAKLYAGRRARLMSAKGGGAIATLIQRLVKSGMHPAALTIAELDGEPDVLWAGGVPYALRGSTDALQAARIDPHTPHLHTAAVVPDERPTPVWDAFLAAVWPDEAVRAWALRVLSVAVTGYSDRAMPILLGPQGRGKTQVVNLIMSVLGSYAHAANAKLLRKTDAHDTIKYDLRGRRLSFIDEAPREDHDGQEQLKQITGGGELTANRMRQDAITFRPTHTLVLTANDEPNLTDPAVRSRARILPCDGDPDEVRRTRAAVGHTNGRVWRDEAPGVLYRLMLEAGRWLADTESASVWAAPEAVRYRAEEIAAEQDPITSWLNAELEGWPDGTGSRELYRHFVATCLQSNIRRDLIPSETKWGRDVTRLGYPVVKTKTGNRRALRVRPWGSETPGPGALSDLQNPLKTPVEGWSDNSEVTEPNSTYLSRSSHETPNTPDTDPSDSSAMRDGWRVGGGLVEGSTQTLHQDTNAGPDALCLDENEKGGGFGGLGPGISHSRVRTHARAGRYPQDGPNPPPELITRTSNYPVDNPVDNSQGGPEAGTKPETKAQARKRETAEAKARLRGELAGPDVQLPALVMRDRLVRALEPAAADELLTTITAPASGPAQPLTVDIENTGYPLGHRLYALQTIQLGRAEFGVVFRHGDPVTDPIVAKHLAAARITHAHSATADVIPLVHAGLWDWDAAWDSMHDTVIPAKLADPDSTGSDPGLKKLADAVLGAAAVSGPAEERRKALFKAHGWLTDTEITTEPDRAGWLQVRSESEAMTVYAASDVLDTAAVAEHVPWPPASILARERAVQRMTARAALDGFRIDGEHADGLRSHHEAERAQKAAKFASQTGLDNPGADRQVAAWLTERGVRLPHTKPSARFPSGQPSVAKGVLEPLVRPSSDVPDDVRATLDNLLEWRHHDTALTTFLIPYTERVRHGDGRARPTVYTLGADTGRMSCVRPNMQQLPREGGVRAIITADPGELLISADFASVEMRVAGALSQDPALLQFLLDGRDIHGEAARLVFGPGYTKSDRYGVKRGVFGWLYGGGVEAVAKGVGCDLNTAQHLIDVLGAMFPVLVAWRDTVTQSVYHGQTTFQAYSGRIIHLPRRMAHAAPNYQIQGTARELLVDALMRWRETRWGNVVIMPVHDEVLARVPEAEAEDATTELVRCMRSELNGVEIAVEASTPSFAWQDAS